MHKSCWTENSVYDPPIQQVHDPAGAGGGSDAMPDGCLPTGEVCVEPENCCTGNCNEGICVGDTGLCFGIGDECKASAECCSGRCEELPGAGQTCVTGGCAGVGDSCTLATDCCGLSCESGTCTDGDTCAMVGSSCGVDTDCCSGHCVQD